MATIEDATAEFDAGLNVVTGETGAGKSVLALAIALAAGAKASSEIVREGATEARIEAEWTFDGGETPADVASALDENGLPENEEPGMLTVRRIVKANGGGRVWINGAAASAGILKAVCGPLVSCHGTGDNVKLADEKFLLEMLDAGAPGTRASRRAGDAAPYRAAWEAYSRAKASLEALEASGGGEEEIEMLRYQTEELEEAAPSAEDDDLRERHAAAAKAESLLESANAVAETLGGDDGAAARIASLSPQFASMTKVLPDAAQWADEAERICGEINELSRCVADAMARIDADEGEFEALDARLGQIERLKRKYLKLSQPGAAAGSALAAVLEEKRARLAELEGRGEELARRRAAAETAFAAVEREGRELAKKRAAAAKALSKAVESELHDLGFLQAAFRIETAACEPGPGGCDAARCVFAPNPGEGERDLAQCASSGETARVMLAVLKTLASHGSVQTVLFDEIDANIGGETGFAVGEKLRAVSRGRQTIAITHLPQSASFADRHLVVSKTTHGGRTRTRVAAVAGDERAEELARMLGGGGAARRHAREMLRANGI